MTTCSARTRRGVAGVVSSVAVVVTGAGEAIVSAARTPAAKERDATRRYDRSLRIGRPTE
jgi:hypothetical protein